VTGAAGPRQPLPSAWAVLGIAVAASPVFASLTALQNTLQHTLERNPTSFWFAWTHLVLPALTLGVCATALLPLVRRFPLPNSRPVNAIIVHAVAVLALPVISLALLDALHVWLDGDRFVEHLFWMLSDIYVERVLAFAAIAALLHAVRHSREQAWLREDALALRAAVSDARMLALMQQLRPHFLFNSLNTVAMLVRADEPDRAVEVLSRLAVLLRELIRDHPHAEVPLSEEFAFAREYLAVEEARFGDRLQIDVQLEAALADAPVPFLLLQPIVENAVRYGVAARAGASLVSVRAARANGSILLAVEERGDGARIGTPEPGTGTGLANTRERLRARYGDDAQLLLSVDDQGAGSLAHIVLPRANA